MGAGGCGVQQPQRARHGNVVEVGRNVERRRVVFSDVLAALA